MSKSHGQYPVVVGVRLKAADVEKLDRLAEQTFRGRGDLLRLLIARAVSTPGFDVVLQRAGESGEEDPCRMS
jgi:hypothetical protein